MQTVVIGLDSDVEPINKLLLEIIKALSEKGLKVESIGFQKM